MSLYTVPAYLIVFIHTTMPTEQTTDLRPPIFDMHPSRALRHGREVLAAELAHAGALKAFRMLEKMIEDPDFVYVRMADRIRAAEILIAYRFGKPKETVQVESDETTKRLYISFAPEEDLPLLEGEVIKPEPNANGDQSNELPVSSLDSPAVPPETV